LFLASQRSPLSQPSKSFNFDPEAALSGFEMALMSKLNGFDS